MKQSAKLPYYASTTTQTVDDILPELLKTTNIDDILRFDRHNFAILNSEIKKVELKKRWEGERLWVVTKTWEGVDLHIVARRKTLKWNDLQVPETKDDKPKKWMTIRDYENMLRPFFGDRLSVRLAMPLQGATGYP